MSIRTSAASEATLLTRGVMRLSATYEITLTGDDLRRLSELITNKADGIPGLISDAIEHAIHSSGFTECWK